MDRGAANPTHPTCSSPTADPQSLRIIGSSFHSPRPKTKISLDRNKNAQDMKEKLEYMYIELNGEIESLASRVNSFDIEMSQIASCSKPKEFYNAMVIQSTIEDVQAFEEAQDRSIQHIDRSIHHIQRSIPITLQTNRSIL